MVDLVTIKVALVIARDGIAERLRGLHEYQLFNLTNETRRQLNVLLDKYNSRDRALAVAIQAISDLINTGFPDDIPTLSVVNAVIDELRADASALEAALSLFEPSQAATLGLLAGVPRLKR